MRRYSIPVVTAFLLVFLCSSKPLESEIRKAAQSNADRYMKALYTRDSSYVKEVATVHLNAVSTLGIEEYPDLIELYNNTFRDVLVGLVKEDARHLTRDIYHSSYRYESEVVEIEARKFYQLRDSYSPSPILVRIFTYDCIELLGEYSNTIPRIKRFFDNHHVKYKKSDLDSLKVDNSDHDLLNGLMDEEYYKKYESQ